MELTKKVAELLNCRECGDEISADIASEIRYTDIVIAYGYSDDGMYFRGAVDGFMDCYDGGTASLNKNGLIHNECEERRCPYHKQLRDDGTKIHALWCAEPDISWTYKTDIPHETFNIMEDGEVFCRGIVFDLEDVA